MMLLHCASLGNSASNCFVGSLLHSLVHAGEVQVLDTMVNDMCTPYYLHYNTIAYCCFIETIGSATIHTTNPFISWSKFVAS